MAVEIDNPYCVVLADTLQTDGLWSHNNPILGGKKVVFPDVIGRVSWKQPSKKTKMIYNRKTQKREEGNEDILYN